MKHLYVNFTKINELLEGRASVFLDFVRGIAAILVVMEHLSSRLFVGYGNVENQGVFVKLLYLLNLLGDPAVIIFFVLSGLFISRTVLKSIFENKWSWLSYLINRLSRLYIVLIPALLLTFALDKLGAFFFGAPDHTTFTGFVGNLFFLQKVFVLPYGSNGPLWSLSYEFWYYMLFPLILLLFVKGKFLIKICYLLMTLLLFLTVEPRMSSYFFIWLIGTTVLLLPATRLTQRKMIPYIAFVLASFAVFLRPLVSTGRFVGNVGTEQLFFADLLVGLTFGFFVYSLLHMKGNQTKKAEPKALFTKTSKLLAGFSFSLYLIHYPMIHFVYFGSVKYGFNHVQPSLLAVLLEILLIAIICVIAYLFSKATEAHTNKLRIAMTKTMKLLKGLDPVSNKRKQNVGNHGNAN